MSIDEHHVPDPTALHRRPSAGGTRRAVLLAALVLGLLVGPAGRAEDWGVPMFEAEPAALLEAADRASEGIDDDVVVLSSERRHSFDETGRDHFRFRETYQILGPRGLEDWSRIDVVWIPWYQERPEIRARVVTRSGREFQLDPSTITESPVVEDSRSMFRDDRILEAQLPGVGVGSVVEMEVVVAESQPAFQAGVVRSAYLADFVPVREAWLRIEAPESTPLQFLSRGLADLTPRRSEEGGRVRLEFRAGPFDAVPRVPAALPFDVTPVPRLAFSTASSWNALARAYGAVIEEKLSVSDVRDRAKEIVRGERNRERRIDLLMRYLSEVRYTGVELGRGAIIPSTPEKTLSRRFGDCKDKATALVALLDGIGIESHVALLRSGYDEDVDRQLPGIGRFNHAIVFVEGDPPLWIDATDELARVGQLPLSDQGRLALVAAPDTEGLVEIPVSGPQDNRVLDVREVTLSEEGPGLIVSTVSLGGAYDTGYRFAVRSEGVASVIDPLTERVTRELAADSVAVTQEPSAEQEHFQCRMEAKACQSALTEGEKAAVGLAPAALLSWVPALLLDEDVLEDRSHDVVSPHAFSIEQRWQLTPPPGFSPAPLPRPYELDLGPLSFRESWEALEDDSVAGTLRLELPRRRLTVEELEALQEAMPTLLDRETVIRFGHSRLDRSRR